MNLKIKELFEESIRVKSVVMNTISDDISKAAQLIIDSLSAGNKILICGNGGSAADAQHFAAEMIGRFKVERKAIPAISLTTNTSIITAWGNDYSFDTIFERQIEALGKSGDVLFGISTSGNSKNVLLAMKKAKELGLRTIGLLGADGGKIKEYSDIALIVPSNDTPRIQESHITIIHILCELIEGRSSHFSLL